MLVSKCAWYVPFLLAVLHDGAISLERRWLRVGCHQPGLSLPTTARLLDCSQRYLRGCLTITWHQKCCRRKCCHRVCTLQLDSCPGHKCVHADMAIRAHQKAPKQHPCDVSLGPCLCKTILAVQPQPLGQWHLLALSACTCRQEHSEKSMIHLNTHVSS